MMKLFSHILLICCGTLIACSPLRKSQTLLVGNYFSALSTFPSNIRQLNERVATFDLEASNLSSALLETDADRVNYLVRSIKLFEERLLMEDSVGTAIDELEQYVRQYYTLVPNGFNIYKALKGTSEGIVGLLGFKSVISSVLPDKNVEITDLKKKKILKHLNDNRVQFRANLRLIKVYTDYYLIPQIDEIDKQYKKDHQVLFENLPDSISSLQYFENYNRRFIDFYQKLIQSRRLATQISISLDRILQVEENIIKLTRTRQKIKKNDAELLTLLNDLQKIKQLLRDTKQ